MPKSFLLKIDVARLGGRLSDPHKAEMTNGDVFVWLLEQGFTISRKGWCASAAKMKLLKVDEIILSERIA